MNEPTAQKQAVIQNLVDAGCDRELIDQFLRLWDAGQRDAELSLLAKHRKFLLDRCHAQQKKIDCLDYLIYNIRRDSEND